MQDDVGRGQSAGQEKLCTRTRDESKSGSFAPIVGRRAVIGAIVTGGCLMAMRGRIAQAASEDAADPKPTLQKGDRFAPDAEGPLKLLKPTDIAAGTALMGVYPVDPATGAPRKETRLNMLNLVRLDDAKAAAESAGILAFSAICTHKGCSITSWEAQEKHWRCFCHMSEFDAMAGGEVVAGPAETGLPVVSLAIDAEGYLTAATPFNADPGAAS